MKEVDLMIVRHHTHSVERLAPVPPVALPRLINPHRMARLKNFSRNRNRLSGFVPLLPVSLWAQ